MQQYNEDDNVDCCDICGATGWKETLLTCSKCKVNREHAYCTKYNTLKIPKDWVCEPCKSKWESTSPRKEDQGISSRASKMHQTGKAAKVKSLSEDEVINLSSGASCTVLSIRKATVGSNPSLIPYSNPPVSSTEVHGNHPRNDEIHKKTITSNHASCPLSKKGPRKECPEEHQQPLGRVIANHNIKIYYPHKEKLANKTPFEASSTRKSSPFADSGPPKEYLGTNQRPMGGVAPAKKVQIHDHQKEKPAKAAPFEALSARKSSPIVGSGGILCANAVQSNIEKHDQSKLLPCSIATWRGQFEILHHTAAPSKFYDGFEAQPPFIVNRKAYIFSREMPSVLKLESRPALKVLTDIFRDDSPKLEDIALYFFPSEQTERSRKNLNSILRFMNDEKSMLRSYIKGVELLIFTPNQLGMDSKGAIAAVNDGHFLWGFFRKKKIDKTTERVPKMEPVDVKGRADHLGALTPKLKFDNNLDLPPSFQ